jgi:hypothetical protein
LRCILSLIAHAIIVMRNWSVAGIIERHDAYSEFRRCHSGHHPVERFHQGLGGQLIVKDAYPENDNGAAGKVRCRARLSGMLNFYVRDAA